MSTMEIEKQRWFPQTGACALTPGGFGWSFPVNQGSLGDKLLFSFDTKEAGPNDINGFNAGAFLKIACTEYSSYPQSWQLVEGVKSSSDMLGFVNNVFEKGGRILDLNGRIDSNGALVYDAILVPNYGPSAIKWWFGLGATESEVNDVLSGKPTPITQNPSPKKLTTVDRLPDGHFAFAVTILQHDDYPWWWFIGMSKDNIDAACAGKAFDCKFGHVKADNNIKRPVSIKQHLFDLTYTVILVQRDQLLTHYWVSAPWSTIASALETHNYRLISIHRSVSATASYSDDRFDAVGVQNS